jgi:hypothetical protein
MSWQYNGFAPTEDIYLWCCDNLKGPWRWTYETIIFDDEQDYTLFLLRWA